MTFTPTDQSLLFDNDGIPKEAPVVEWLDLAEATHETATTDARWLQETLRFSRPDGSSVFGSTGRSPARFSALNRWADRVGDPSLSGVIRGWGPIDPASRAGNTPLPVPSNSRPDRPLAVLRPDWTVKGDFLAIDHRQPGDRTLLEVSGRGVVWLGPGWTSRAVDGSFTRACPTSWVSSIPGDSVEWAYEVGEHRVVRTATWLRGRSLALLSQQMDGAADRDEIRLELPERVEATRLAGTRRLRLTSGRGKPVAQLIPLGLPDHDRPTELGSIEVEGREVVIRQTRTGRRGWVPVLVCWGKPPTTWRRLTVAFHSRASIASVAQAFRVAWGPRDEALVIYRSLAPPSLRSFLGHQTAAGFLVGMFTRTGDVRPLVKRDR